MPDQVVQEPKVEVVRKYKRLPITNEGVLLDLGSIRIKSPQNLVIVKYPKSGSTLSICNVPKILIADSERGTEYFSANNKVNLLDETTEGKFVETKRYGYIPKTIYDLVSELYEANKMAEYWELKAKFDLERDLVTKQKMYDELLKKINNMPFPIVAIDTITSIVNLSNDAALYEYNLHVKPESKKEDIKRTDEYGGVSFIRRKFGDVKNFLEQNAAPFLQFHGHIGQKKKILKKGEEDISVLDIALEGVLSTIFTCKADSVATFYRNEDGCWLDFLKKEETALGSRPFHLSNKLIKVAETLKIDQEFPVTHWELIYPEIEALKGPEKIEKTNVTKKP